MANNIVLSFALLFGATIALICSVYLFLANKKKIKEAREREQTEQTENNLE